MRGGGAVAVGLCSSPWNTVHGFSFAGSQSSRWWKSHLLFQWSNLINKGINCSQQMLWNNKALSFYSWQPSRKNQRKASQDSKRPLELWGLWRQRSIPLWVRSPLEKIWNTLREGVYYYIQLNRKQSQTTIYNAKWFEKQKYMNII